MKHSSFTETPSLLKTQPVLNDVNTLVFEGGSVKGLVYVGALKALSQTQPNFLQQVTSVAGCSAGAIMALLVALGLNVDQVYSIMKHTAFASFADMGRLAHYSHAGKGYRLYQQGYLCEGDAFLGWVEQLLETYTGKKDITFAQFAAHSQHKALFVYAVRLNDGQVVEFSHLTTPHVRVALALRMSMSIPVFFKPVRVTETVNGLGERHVEVDTQGTTYYVDGGVKANYPYAQIKERLKLEHRQLLGFKVGTDVERLEEETFALPSESPLHQTYTQRIAMTQGYGPHLLPKIIGVLMSPQDEAHVHNRDEKARTIHASDCGISTFDFALTETQVEHLVAAGAYEFMRYVSLDPTHWKLPQDTTSAQARFTATYLCQEMERMQPIVAEVQAEAIHAGDALDNEQLAYLKQLREDLMRLKGDAGQLKGRIVLVEGHATVGDGFQGTINTETKGGTFRMPATMNAAQQAFWEKLIEREQQQIDNVHQAHDAKDIIGIAKDANVGKDAKVEIRDGHTGGTYQSLEERVTKDTAHLEELVAALTHVLKAQAPTTSALPSTGGHSTLFRPAPHSSGTAPSTAFPFGANT